MKNILGAYLAPHPPIIIDKIGRGEEKKTEKTIKAMEEMARDIKKKKPSTIVLISPHGPLFKDAISISGERDLGGSFRRFGFPGLQYKYKNNLDLVNKIIEKSQEADINIAKVDKDFARAYDLDLELDHGALVPLHFIEKEYKDFNLLHITYGLLPMEELYSFGKLIRESLEDLEEDALIVASGDLSHRLLDSGPYTYSPAGEKFDKKIIEMIREKDLRGMVDFDLDLAEEAGECGLRSLIIMAGSLDGLAIETEVLSYEGPFGVGYSVARVDIEESKYVKLARKTLESFIKKGKEIEPEELSGLQRGVFVTIKKDGKLRGCIGTILPTRPSLEEEIVQNAISAGTSDPRFSPVKEEELENLVYSVDILSQPEAISSKDQLDIDKYGVIVSKGRRRGLLLPKLDGVESVDHQVDIALSKAGISPDQDYKLERFKVERYY